MTDHDDASCTCPEHRQLGAAALVLHEQGIGCNWHGTVGRNRYHYKEVNELTVLGLSEIVWDVGPFVHDGWHHDGDHEAVVAALMPTLVIDPY